MKADSLIPLGPESLSMAAREAIHESHTTIADLYDSLDSPEIRASVSAYMARDPTIQHVEAAVLAQYQIIAAPGTTPAARDVALSRVREGMEYWKNLIRKKMGKMK
jgi:hypothetical protein